MLCPQVFVDVTAEVKARMQRGFLCSTFNGHIHTAGVSALHSKLQSTCQHAFMHGCIF